MPRRQSAAGHRRGWQCAREHAPMSLMHPDHVATTAMAREIAEIPVLAGRLLARQGVIGAIADHIRQAAPRIVIVCGRGSSGHVGVYFRYLIEARIGLLVSAAAPSIVTAYRRRPDM